MLKTGVNILKSSDVKVEGEFRLEIAPPTEQSPRLPGRAGAAAQVRIVEKHPEYAIIEFTCACGNKSHIKCQYDQNQSTTNQAE